MADTDSDNEMVDAAGGGPRTANAQLAAVIKDLDEVRTLLPAARADLTAAEQQFAAAADADRAAQADPEQATAAAIRAEVEWRRLRDLSIEHVPHGRSR